MRVAFRVDASARIGGGHLARCLSLAQALRAHRVETQFLCRAQQPCPAGWPQTSEHRLAILSGPPESDAEQTIGALRDHRIDWLVLDHYELGIDWERRLRARVPQLMVIDDVPGREHDCHMLVNQNLLPCDAVRYAGLVPANCRLVLGPAHALLRDEFRAARERLVPRIRRLERVLVFFTAGEDHGETLKAMRGVELSGAPLEVDVVVGASTAADEIERRCASRGWGYHRQVDYMAQLISRADVVLGAAGSSSWERCALGVPAIVTRLASNQELVAETLIAAGAAISLGTRESTTAERYAGALRSLSEGALAAMSQAAMALVDGLGARRVAALLAGARAVGSAA